MKIHVVNPRFKLGKVENSLSHGVWAARNGAHFQREMYFATRSHFGIGACRLDEENAGPKSFMLVRVPKNERSLSGMGLTQELWCCTKGWLSRLDMNTGQTSIKTGILL